VFCSPGHRFYRRIADCRSKWDRSQAEARSRAVHIEGAYWQVGTSTPVASRFVSGEWVRKRSCNKLNANFTIHFRAEGGRVELRSRQGTGVYKTPLSTGSRPPNLRTYGLATSGGYANMIACDPFPDQSKFCLPMAWLPTRGVGSFDD
jgi:hypothetical protein